ncbi:MAG: hypothetical protein ACRDMZ_20725 [Solirubrobacteraceae bacterium]
MTSKLRQQLFGLWCAPIFTVGIALGWLGLAHFWHPAPADLDAQATKAFFVDLHRDGMLLGNSILIVACAFLVVVSIQFGLMLAELEGRRPLWSITTAVCGILIALIVFLNAGFWIGAAYRPDAPAELIVALNDVAWLGFLLGWVFLSLQMVATAIVALGDDSARPLIPHALSKASLVGAALLICAGGPAFTHSGPFAYHGLLAFYLPMLIWGLWLDVHAWYRRRRLLDELGAE